MAPQILNYKNSFLLHKGIQTLCTDYSFPFTHLAVGSAFSEYKKLCQKRNCGMAVIPCERLSFQTLRYNNVTLYQGP